LYSIFKETEFSSCIILAISTAPEQEVQEEKGEQTPLASFLSLAEEAELFTSSSHPSNTQQGVKVAAKLTSNMKNARIFMERR
jgi:hypothetical protein